MKRTTKHETKVVAAEAEVGTGERCHGCDCEITLTRLAGHEIAVQCACTAVAALA